MQCLVLIQVNRANAAIVFEKLRSDRRQAELLQAAIKVLSWWNAAPNAGAISSGRLRKLLVRLAFPAKLRQMTSARRVRN
jgi:hypothetical protein